MESKQEPTYYVASRTYWTELDGAPVLVKRGERVRAGHPLVAANPEAFTSGDDGLAHEHLMPGGVEDASAAPGSQRDPSVAAGAAKGTVGKK